MGGGGRCRQGAGRAGTQGHPSQPMAAPVGSSSVNRLQFYTTPFGGGPEPAASPELPESLFKAQEGPAVGRTGRVHLSAAGRAEAGRGPRPGLWECGETGRGARPALNPRPGPPRPRGGNWEPVGTGTAGQRALDHGHLHPQARSGRRGRGQAGAGIRNVQPKARSARGGRPGAEPLEGVEAGGLRWELQVKEPAGAGTEGQAQHGDEKPLPPRPGSPSPGGDGEAEREAPRRCTLVHARHVGVMPPRQTPRPAQLAALGAARPHTLRKAAIRPAWNTRPAGPQWATGPGRWGGSAAGGLSYHLLAPDVGPAYGVLPL